MCDETLLLSASLGPRGGRSALYRMQPGTNAFEKCVDGLPEWFTDNIDTYTLAGRGPRAAFGTSDGSVFVSSDHGATWEEIATGLAAIHAVIPDDEGAWTGEATS